MVDEKQVKKVLPKILVDGDPRYKSRHSEYVTKKMKLRRIERNNKQFFSSMIRKTKRFFDEIEKALKEDFEF